MSANKQLLSVRFIVHRRRKPLGDEQFINRG